MLTKISQVDIYQLEKADLLSLIRKCGVDPGDNQRSKELRKIGACLKRLGKIVENDLELQGTITKLQNDPSYKLSPRDTSVCPELQLFSLLVQGEFKTFFENIEKTPESSAGAQYQSLTMTPGPRMQTAPPPPPQSPPPVIETNTAINVLAEELKKMQGLVKELMADRKSNVKPENVELGISGQIDSKTKTRFVGLDEAIRDLEVAQSMNYGFGRPSVTDGIHRLSTDNQCNNIPNENYNQLHDSNRNLNDREYLQINQTKTPSFELVAVLPTFNGDDDEVVSDFIAQVNEVGSLSNWSELNKLTVAKLKLSGTALSFSKSDEGCKSAKTLFEFQEALEARFRDKMPEHYYLEQLACIRQEQRETIEQFADRVKRIGSKTVRRTQNPLVDQALQREADRRTMEAFTRGLYGELGHEVRIKFPQSFREAVTLAVTIRNVERRPVEESKNRNSKGLFFSRMHEPIKCQNCHKFGHSLQECRAQQMKPRLMNQPNIQSSYYVQTPVQNLQRSFQNPQGLYYFNRNSNQPNYQTKTCYYCKRNGHLEEECRTKLRQVNINLPPCQVCGKRGHTAQVCRFAQGNRNLNQNGRLSNSQPPMSNPTPMSNSPGGTNPATGPPNYK